MPRRPRIKYPHVVSFRLTDSQAILAEHLRASFCDQTWGEVGRWIFTDPEVRALIEKRIDEGCVEVEYEYVPTSTERIT